MKAIFIIGLRRSGTTAFWEDFRDDVNLLCFDEPFNPNLRELPHNNKKNTRDKFINLYKSDQKLFTAMFKPMDPVDEIHPFLTEPKKLYLRRLLTQGEKVVIDTVRCNFKLESIKEVAPKGYVIHLYRNPLAWTSSHMIPLGKGGWRKPLGDLYRKTTFWYRKSFYNNWQYQEVIEQILNSENRFLFVAKGIYPFHVDKMSAVGRLMALWYLVYLTVEQAGMELFGKRFLSLPFEAFCRDPVDVISRVYKMTGESVPDLNLERIRPSNPGYKPDSNRWNRYADWIDIPKALLNIDGVKPISEPVRREKPTE